MADKKTGPVKPPIIDAKARKAEGADAGKPDANTESQTSAGAKTVSPGTQAKSGDESRTGQTTQPSATPEASASKPGSDKPSADEPGLDTPKFDTNARTDRDKPDPKNTTAGKSETQKSQASTPGASAASPVGTGALVATGLGGAVLGLALAYGIAAFGLWPTSAPETDPTSELQSRVADLEAAISQSTGTSSQLETEILDLGTRVETLSGAVSALEGIEPVAPGDFEALSARFEELANTVNAVSAGASGDEATRIGTDIAALQSEVDTIGTTLETLTPAFETLRTDVESLRDRTNELETALADQPEIEAIAAERDRFAQIPQIIATLERQMAAGEPFATTLAELETALPDLDIAQSVRTASTTGIAPADAIADDLRAAIPALLAARPQDPNAGILETLMQQTQAAIALRPAGEVSGNSPDARIARAETALENENLAAARDALAGLPQSMQQVAAPILAKIDAALAGQTLLEAARAAGNGSGEAAQ